MSGKGYQKYSIGTIAAITVIILLAGASAYAAIQNLIVINSSGNLHTTDNIGAFATYVDAVAGSPYLTNINWSTMYYGDNISRVLYLRNFGDKPLNLSLTTSNLVIDNTELTISNYMNISWNRENTTILRKQIIDATIWNWLHTLPTQYTGTVDFSFNATICAYD